jgi:hypothetical protein
MHSDLALNGWPNDLAWDRKIEQSERVSRPSIYLDSVLTNHPSYANQLAIVGFITCSVVAILFHFAGVSSFSSTLIIGPTIAIFDQVEDVSISLRVKDVGRALGLSC